MDTIEIYLSKLSAAKELYMEIAEKSGDDTIDCKDKLMLSLEQVNTPAEYKVYISDEDISNDNIDEIKEIFQSCAGKNENITAEFITDEFLNLLDENERLTQKSKPRSLVHRDGDLHAVVHIWIIQRKDMGIYVLLQKRSDKKQINPGCYDVSAAGHITQGGEPRKTAVREIYEELGLKVPNEKLKIVGVHRNTYCNGIVKDNELSAVYIYNEPVDIDSLTICEDEVAEVCWAEIDEMLTVMKNGEFLNCISLEELAMIKKATF